MAGGFVTDATALRSGDQEARALSDVASMSTPGQEHRQDVRLDELISPAVSPLYDFTKRIVDVVISGAAMIVLSPVFAAVALAVKLTSCGPVFFSQVRAGLNETPFTMYKFRSMKVGAETDREFLSHMNAQGGPVFKAFQDPRLTPIGRFLRRSSIDELPQLLNVLVGRMTLVGPRPLWMPEARKVEGMARLRTAVKPGLTCLWQVSGRSELSYQEWVQLDLFYISRRSFLLDILIMIQTIPAVLSAHGAY
ncbi:MAG: sugar transferase [Pseudomonadota bacterium]